MFKLIAIASLLFLMPSFAMETSNTDFLLFIGNPGAGKSAIINAIKKAVVAKSGFSIGTGLTTAFDKYEHYHNGKKYILCDTPGLNDIKYMKEAGIQITKALKQEGNYHLFFVITVDGGRIQTSDLTMMEMVLKAIKLPNVSYNVIINKVTSFAKVKGKLDLFLQLENYPMPFIGYIGQDDDLENEKKPFLDASNWIEFIYQENNSNYIRKSDVDDIVTDKFQVLQQEHEKLMEQLKKEQEELLRREKIQKEKKDELHAEIENVLTTNSDNHSGRKERPKCAVQ